MSRWPWFIVGALLLTGGCDSAPRAPALRDSPVYHNPSARFRFLIPERWLQTANATLPPDKFENELLVTQFRLRTSATMAMLEVLCFEASFAPDVAKYHADPSHGVADWSAAKPPETVTVTNIEGKRFRLRGTLGNGTVFKEVLSFQRGGRVFSFIGIYGEQDENAREQLRQALDSLIWE